MDTRKRKRAGGPRRGAGRRFPKATRRPVVRVPNAAVPMAMARYGFSGSRGERKYSDVEISMTLADNASVVQLLNGIAQDTTVSGRVGNNVTMKSVYLRIHMNPTILNNAGTVGFFTGATVRLILVLDMQANLALAVPNATDILEAQLGQAGVDDMIKMANRARFRVLWDKEISLQPMTVDSPPTHPWGTGNCIAFTKKFKRLGNIITQYTGITNTIGAISTNSLLLLGVTDAAANNCPVSVYGTSRLRYSDN